MSELQLHWDHRVTDRGEAQWAFEALGVTFLVTELADDAYLLTTTDLAGGPPGGVPALSRPVKCDSEEDAKKLAQSWYEKLVQP
jgi:hypothetical protein